MPRCQYRGIDCHIELDRLPARFVVVRLNLSKLALSVLPAGLPRVKSIDGT